MSGRPAPLRAEPTVGCVVLTMGDRPAALTRALASVRRQRGVAVTTVVVHNAPLADPPPEVGAGVTVVRPGRNLGIPAGRNLGVDALRDTVGDEVDVVLFLDDDGELVGDDVLIRVLGLLHRFDRLAVVSLRIVDPASGDTARRHVPRLRVGDPSRSSWVTTFLGGASVHRVDAFRSVGGLPAEFVYAHEETSLAWRLLDAGWRLAYAGRLAMAHPATSPARHDEYHHRTARNRVLLARRHLPTAVGVSYVAAWTLVGLLREPGSWRAALQGLSAGLAEAAVPRDPIRWRTIGRMTLEGRPPLL